jgi:RHS repeat-associated protein
MKSWVRFCRIIAAVSTVALFGMSSHAQAAAGRTPGSYNITPAGAATYTIPIWAPRGPNDLEPHMALSYSSQSGIGFLGVGWNLGGLSSIYRCTQTYAQDPAPAPVTLSSSDVFCMDGQRLRLTGGTYGDPGSTYQTEIANFSNVTAEGTAGNGPSYFEVQGRDGRTYEYGFDGNSQVLASGTSTAWVWWLDKVTDRAGNTMTLSYTTQNGTAVPNTISWTPVSEGAQTYTYTMQFTYGTNVPQSSIYAYVGGTEYTDTSLLTAVSIIYNGTTVKQYNLSYHQSPTTGRDELIQVQECADSAGSNCLAPTKFTYQSGQIGVSTSATSAISALATRLKAHNDFNGDGLNDLAYCTGSSSAIIYVAFASASGYSSPVNTGISCTNPVYGDLNAGGKDGILAPNGTDWWYYIWNGSSFTGQDTGLAYDSTASQYVFADVNGDGLPDLIAAYVSCTPSCVMGVNVRLNTTSGTSVSFASTKALWYTTAAKYAGIVISDTDHGYGAQQYGTLKALDFNGDGRQDLAVETVTGTAPNYVTQTYELISGTSSFTPVLITTGTGGSLGAVTFLDFNSDSCTDYVFGSTVYVSGCNGTVPVTGGLGSSTVIGAMDWDGDGRTDILVQNGSTIGVYLSEGYGVSSIQSTSIPYASSSIYFAFDANGDGLDDLGAYAGAGTVTYNLHNGVGQMPDLLSSVTDGYGNTVSPTYTSILQGAYSDYTYSSPVYPYELYRAPLYVVSNAVFSDPTNPPNGTYSKSYDYIGAWSNLQGRGFSNFMNVETHDSRNNVWRLDCYENKFPFSGSYVCTRLSLDQAGTQLIRSRFGNHALTTLDATPNNERYFIWQNGWTDQIHQVSDSSTGPLIETDSMTYAYDNYGNATSIATTKTDNDSGSPYVGDSWTTTVTNTPDVSVNSWCLTLLSASTVTYAASDGSPSVTRTRQYTPDAANCRYTQIQTEPNSTTYDVTEALGYDSFGNINSDTVTGIGMAARQTSADWGTTGQFPMTVTDATGASTQFNYNFSNGLISSETDPNGANTSWQYGDGFGRVTQETRPDGTYTQYSYSACDSSNSYCGYPDLRLNVEMGIYGVGGSKLSWRAVYTNAVDAIRFQEAQNMSGGETYVETYYDALGRMVRRSMPVISTEYDATYSYDALNRLLQVQRPTSASNSTPAVTGYAYAGDTTTITDADTNARVLVHDPNGLLRKTEDATGYAIILSYDAAGGHTGTTDTAGNTLWSGTVQYGIAPFTVLTNDADLGTWHYSFDALGELTAWSDAKGQSFSAHYDALSRMTDRYEPDLYSHWTWGTSAAAHEIGQLHSVCTGTGVNSTACNSSGYAESETYDSDGRPYQRSIAIPGDTTYTYTRTYNATTGLLDTLAYPADPSGYRLQVKYGYSGGFLQSITDISDSPNVALWTGNSVDARNQYTQETFGNGVVVNHNFDAVTGMINGITAGPSGSAALQNNSYLYDGVGNVIQRQDINAGVTESVYYDSLNRLSHTVGDTSTQMTYDALGRIATWTTGASSANVNDYMTAQSGCTYYANAQPHAVRVSTQGSWPASSFCYDANGNYTTQIVSGVAQVADTWTSFNQPNKLAAPTLNSYSQFYYDPNHQRYEQVASYSGSLESTEYIGGLLERMSNSSGTSYRYYVPAGNNLVVYNRWVGGTAAFDYATNDNLGSTAVITDQTGALVVSEKYAALGWNENTAAQQSAMAGITRHGFTGQEGLSNPGIWAVNMNGRVYQPSGSRFFSPDPNIFEPENTQDYNRYSYVHSNPLTDVDPTGFASECQQLEGDDTGNQNYNCLPSPPPMVPFPGPGVCIGECGAPLPLVCIPCFITPQPLPNSPTISPGEPAPSSPKSPAGPGQCGNDASCGKNAPQQQTKSPTQSKVCQYASSNPDASELAAVATTLGIDDNLVQAIEKADPSFSLPGFLGEAAPTMLSGAATGVAGGIIAGEVRQGQYLNATLDSMDMGLGLVASKGGGSLLLADTAFNALGGFKQLAKGAANVICVVTGGK